MAEAARIVAAAGAGMLAGILVTGRGTAVPTRRVLSRLRSLRVGTGQERPRGWRVWRLPRHGFGRGPARELGADLELLMLALAAELEAGASVPQAFQRVSSEVPTQIADEVRDVATRAARGDWIQPIRDWARRRDDPILHDLAVTLEIHQGTGGSLGPILRRLAVASRTRRLMMAQARSKSAEARLSARVLICAPVAVTAYLGLQRPELLVPLWTTVPGRLALTYGVVSWMLGVLWIRWLLRSVEHVGR